MSVPNINVDISHSEVIDRFPKEKPAKLGAYRVIWSHPEEHRVKSIFMVPVRLIQTIIATLGLALYRAGIVAAWVAPAIGAVVIGTLGSPIYALAGCFHEGLKKGVQFGYMSGGVIGGLVGAPVAYALCSLGNLVTKLGVGKSVKQLYAVNSPKTLAVFSLVVSDNRFSKSDDLALRRDRKVTYDTFAKPVVKTLPSDAYSNWMEDIKKEFEGKKQETLKWLEEGNVGKFRKLWKDHAIPLAKLSREDRKKVIDFVQGFSTYEDAVKSRSAISHAAFTILLFSPINNKKDQTKIDEDVQSVKNEYQYSLKLLADPRHVQMKEEAETECQALLDIISAAQQG